MKPTRLSFFDLGILFDTDAPNLDTEPQVCGQIDAAASLEVGFLTVRQLQSGRVTCASNKRRASACAKHLLRAAHASRQPDRACAARLHQSAPVWKFKSIRDTEEEIYLAEGQERIKKDVWTHEES
ncbi:Hypothetical predicted protein [Pelobates cultripes]|uniref:Uncharacterized protein n=1 Tax=Pelobates cultripes TaxID=61616 RepID=A0AAD1VVE2_PELCU|nr:Hypothetical predicted protein [Pelobates cultripes]